MPLLSAPVNGRGVVLPDEDDWCPRDEEPLLRRLSAHPASSSTHTIAAEKFIL